jgi:hypothetical protein
MNKDEVDLSQFPSYLRLPGQRTGEEDAPPDEAVLSGLISAAFVGLLGVALGVLVSRQTWFTFNLDLTTGALTSAAMVLVYAWRAGAAPQRGRVPLVVLLVLMTVIGFFALYVARAWWVYDILSSQFGEWTTRSEFVSFVLSLPDPARTIGNLVAPYVLFNLAGSCLALWKVRPRPSR